jgi:hypothetical protein
MSLKVDLTDSGSDFHICARRVEMGTFVEAVMPLADEGS